MKPKPLEKIKNTDSVNIVFYVIIIAAAILLFDFRKPNTMKSVYVVNITADIAGMFVALVISICGMVDAKKSGESHSYFLSIINVVFVGLFADEVAWLVDGYPEYRWINFIDNSVYYFCTTLLGLYFWHYVTNLINEDSRHVRRITLILEIGVGLAVILRIINVFTGIYFTVDKTGTYKRGPFFFAPMFYSLLSLFLTFLLIKKNKEKLELRQRAALILYIFTPLTVSLLTILVYGLSISFPVLVVELVLMYGMVNIERGVRKAMIDKDLSLASKIQEGMLPREFPAFPYIKEFDLYASMDPAKEVGGDFYDFFLTDEDHLALIVADVSGKGVPAALFMMVSKALLKNRLQNGDTPGQALYNVNNQLLKGGQETMFVTVWLAILEISTGKGISVNAGHEHPMLRRAGGAYEAIEYKHSVPVAAVEDMKFKEREFNLNRGDILFVYTDGVTDAMSTSKEFLGLPGALRLINSTKGDTPEEVIREMKAGLSAFTEGAEQFDDITMLCLKYNG